MSSDTDRPRQRTVAELLAEHGAGGATGRRRRRRVTDEPNAGASGGSAPPVESRPARTSDEPAPNVAAPTDSATASEATAYQMPAYQMPAYQMPAYQMPADQAPAPREPDLFVPRDPAPPAPLENSWPEPAAPALPEQQTGTREWSTDVMSPIFEPVEQDHVEQDHVEQDHVEQDHTGPPPPESEDPDEGPSTMIGGAPVEAQDWHRVRTEPARRGGTAIDAGPALPPKVEPVSVPVDLYTHDDDARYEDEDEDAPSPRSGRLGRGRATAPVADVTSPSWSAVVVQWIAGAVVGAVLWVLFRFLWSTLPVVAVASAVVVTVGLVILVRALLHSNDKRTTIFAVLVGLLLTVSPALLVLMGR